MPDLRKPDLSRRDPRGDGRRGRRDRGHDWWPCSAAPARPTATTRGRAATRAVEPVAPIDPDDADARDPATKASRWTRPTRSPSASASRHAQGHGQGHRQRPGEHRVSLPGRQEGSQTRRQRVVLADAHLQGQVSPGRRRDPDRWQHLPGSATTRHVHDHHRRRRGRQADDDASRAPHVLHRLSRSSRPQVNLRSGGSHVEHRDAATRAHARRARRTGRRHGLGPALLRARGPHRQPSHERQPAPLPPRRAAPRRVHPVLPATRHLAARHRRSAGLPPRGPHPDVGGLVPALRTLALRPRRPHHAAAEPARQPRRLHRLRLPVAGDLRDLQLRGLPRDLGPGPRRGLGDRLD